MFGHDDELPAGFQDADLEMRELTEAANRAARLRARGICDHVWSGPQADKPGRRICYHCGADLGKLER